MNYKFHFPVFFLVLTILSCSGNNPAGSGPLSYTQTRGINIVEATGQPKKVNPSVTRKQIPSQTPAPSPTTSPTPFPTSTPTFHPTLSPQAEVTPSSLQLSVFEELWHIVDKDYLYLDFNGVDWEQTYQDYHQLITTGLNEADFYQTMKQLINSLGDDHSVFFDPYEAKQIDKEVEGDLDYVGIGILTITSPKLDRITILLTLPESPAEEAGLDIHDSILFVDGHPIIDDRGVRHDLIRGTEASTVELTVQSPGEAPRLIKLTRRTIDSQMPVPFEVLFSPEGNKIGYLLLPTFRDTNMDEKIRDALIQMSSNSQLDGLIIDNRYNSGGSSDVLIDSLSLFTSGNVGYFMSQNIKIPLTIPGEDLFGSQDLPLVVLIGDGTASFGEIFAGILGDIGRAFLIGEKTGGNVEILHVYEFEDGSRAWIAHEKFIPLNHPQENWEEAGITPNISITSQWDEITTKTDPVILAAMNYFDSLY